MQTIINIPFLYTSSIILNLLIGLILWVKNRKAKNKSINSFIFLVLSVIIWIISLAGIYFFAFIKLNEELLIWFIKLAYAASVCINLFFFRFFYLYPKISHKLPKFILSVINFLAPTIIFLSLFTKLIYDRPVIENNVYIADIFGGLYLLYTAYFITSLSLTAFLSIYKIFELKGIEQRKMIFASLGAWIFIFMTSLTNIILPLWNIYIFQFESPLFAIPLSFFAFYSTFQYRFRDIKFTTFQILKKTILLIIVAAVSFGFYFIIQLINYINDLTGYILSFIFGFFIYSFFLKFFNLFVHNHLLYSTTIDNFLEIINQFQKTNLAYKDFNELKANLHQIFNKKLGIDKVKIIINDNKNIKKYPNLINFFQKNKNILVTKEIPFIEEKKQIIFPFHKELKSLGEICMPLYHPSQSLLGFFILGKKPFDRIYTKEEIEALESINIQLSVLITSILYSSELQKAVKVKTKEIREQNIEITKLLNEKTKLLAQQSDFIAVTAHELRTPLTVAILQVYETTKHHKKNKKLQAEMEVLKEALNNLKNLTGRLFNLLQFEFEKISLTLERVNLSEFMDRVYEDFGHLMAEKNITFSMDKKLKPESFSFLDTVYMRQLTQNLIVNAIKFTPYGGTIRLVAKETSNNFSIGVADSGEGVPRKTRKSIFEKFKSNHTMNSPGLGLGLYICTKIVELHHGKIWVGDNPGGGALFWAQFPKVLKAPEKKEGENTN